MATPPQLCTHTLRRRSDETAARRGVQRGERMTGNQAQPRSVPLDQRLARIVARPLARTPITPNMVTLFGLGLGLTGAYLFAQGAAAVHWGAALFVIAAWTDHIDGELARLTNKTSDIGHWLDHAAALMIYAATFVGIGIGERAGPLGGWAVALGVAAGLGVAAIFGTRILIELRRGRAAIKQTVRGGFEIEDAVYIVGPLTWFGALMPLLIAAGIGTPIFLLWVIWRAAAELRGDRPPPPT